MMYTQSSLYEEQFSFLFSSSNHQERRMYWAKPFSSLIGQFCKGCEGAYFDAIFLMAKSKFVSFSEPEVSPTSDLHRRGRFFWDEVWVVVSGQGGCI